MPLEDLKNESNFSPDLANPHSEILPKESVIEAQADGKIHFLKCH